ncbi:hypothetical protein UlMin_038479 [Ulmus minor]
MHVKLENYDTQLLEEIFWPIDIAEITNITVPRNREADKLWWFFEKKGSYTVKSGYKLACDPNNPIFDSTSAGGSNWWTTLWTLKLPPKINFFLWRSCLNALPTKDNLVKRGIKTLQSCPRCGEVQESVLHVFFECIYARSLWEDSIFHTQVLSAQSSSYIDRVSLIHAKNAKEDFELFCDHGSKISRTAQVSTKPRRRVRCTRRYVLNDESTRQNPQNGKKRATSPP